MPLKYELFSKQSKYSSFFLRKSIIFLLKIKVSVDVQLFVARQSWREIFSGFSCFSGFSYFWSNFVGAKHESDRMSQNVSG